MYTTSIFLTARHIIWGNLFHGGRHLRWCWKMTESAMYMYCLCLHRIFKHSTKENRWEDSIKVDLHEVGCGVSTGLSWLWIETGGGHL
jgi:hypothetical protein